jgi:hypothetical protein
MDIYSTTTLQSDANETFSVDELVQQFKTADGLGNRAKVRQCVICAQIQNTLNDEFSGKLNTSPYKKRLDKILSDLDIKRKSFNKDAAVGRFVISKNDPTIYDLPKSKIEAMFIEPKPKKERVAKRDVRADLESLRAALRVFVGQRDPEKFCLFLAQNGVNLDPELL